MNLRASTRLVAAFAWLLSVVVVSSLSPLRSAGGVLAATNPQDSQKDSERRKDDPRAREAAAPAAQDTENTEKPADPLAPLSRAQLPPRTRVPPDASRDQYVRDAVFVRIGEVIISSKGEEILPEVQVVGDDLTVTNVERLKTAISRGSIGALLLKLNQIGTVSEAMEAVRLCREKQLNIIVSHRSGETEDCFISDFSVGINAGQIKTGAPARGERTAKYNQLIRIEERMLVQS